MQTLHPSFSAIPEGGSLGEPGGARMIQEDEKGSGGSQGFQWPQVLGPQVQHLHNHVLVGTIFDRGSPSHPAATDCFSSSNGCPRNMSPCALGTPLRHLPTRLARGFQTLDRATCFLLGMVKITVALPSKVGMLSRIVAGRGGERAPNFELCRGGSRTGGFSGRYPERWDAWRE